MTVWQLPFPVTKITSAFGWRKNPFNGEQQFHTGVDWGGVTGKNILAPADGKVVYVGYNGNGHGHYVWVRATDGTYYECAHLVAATKLKVGATVTRGATVIGVVGGSGAVTGPHLHFVISVAPTLAAAINLTRDYLREPIGYITARDDVPLLPTQRLVVVSELRRRSYPATDAPIAGDPLLKGEIGNFIGYTIGEEHTVETGAKSKLWAQGTSGNWFGMAGLEPATGDGLPFVVNPDPDYAAPVEKTIRSDIANARVRATPAKAGAVVREVAAGSTITPIAWTKGQQVNEAGVDTNVWWKVTDGYIWAGSTTSQDTAGITEEKLVEPPPTPQYPANPPAVFTPAAPFVTRVVPAAWSNFENEFSVPLEQNRKGFPPLPTGVVVHQWGEPGAYSLSSVVNTISGMKTPGNEVGAHFVIGLNAEGKVEIVQMGQLSWRMYGSGAGGNGYFQLEVDPLMTPAIIEAVRLVLAFFRDRNNGGVLDLHLHRDIPGASTSCGTYIAPHLDELDVTIPEEPTDPEPVDRFPAFAKELAELSARYAEV
jgi:hypothetical protein